MGIITFKYASWFRHVERSSGAIRTACDIQIDGRCGGVAGMPKLTWKKLTETAVSGSSLKLTLKKGAPGDQV